MNQTEYLPPSLFPSFLPSYLPLSLEEGRDEIESIKSMPQDSRGVHFLRVKCSVLCSSGAHSSLTQTWVCTIGDNLHDYKDPGFGRALVQENSGALKIQYSRQMFFPQSKTRGLDLNISISPKVSMPLSSHFLFWMHINSKGACREFKESKWLLCPILVVFWFYLSSGTLPSLWIPCPLRPPPWIGF